MAWLEPLAILLSVCFETRIIEANQLDTGQATISTFKNLSLYGYRVSLQNISGEASLVVGSPPATPQNGTGNLQQCRISSPATPNDTTLDIACSVLPRATALPNDNIGQSFSTNPHTGEVLTCSTSSVQTCTNLNTVPGFCYILNTTSIPPKWKLLDHAKTRGCPLTSTVDVLFVLDGSLSVSRDNFDKTKNWTNRVIDKLKVDEGIAKVAVIQFGSRVRVEINLDVYERSLSLQRAIRRIVYQQGDSTNTVDALNKSKEVLQYSNRVKSRSNNQVMIILTDGGSTQDGVLTAANNLRDMKVVTYSIGVGGLDVNQLRELATGDSNSKERVYEVDNFDNLGTIVNDLQQQIESFIPNEGAGNLTVEFAQAGFGVAFTKNGRLYLGAVGAYDWSGTVTKYDSVDDQQPDIPGYTEVQKVLPDRTKESYMGYSVTTGYFVNEREEYVATGAPRYKLMGAVVVYKPLNSDAKFNNHVTLTGNKKQLGSYFGGSVLAEDVNADGLDDLFVGAPLYVDQNYDEGRVFVFLSIPGRSSLGYWSGNYEPLELTGDNLPGGRFGTAMASAGDLNMDGYNDIIVGAPLTEGDRGAVFVYHGSSNGMDKTFKQKILASEMTGVTLKYFGQSLQGGVDLDGNKYPDIAVGAPKSDTVVIFRSRPVVKITAEIAYNTSDIDIFECIDKKYENCTVVEVCFTAEGTSVEDQIGIKFNVTMDSGKVGADKRLEFREGQENPKSTWSEEYQLNKASKKCFQKNVHMKRAVKDYDAKIMADVEYDLLPSHTAKPLSSVRDPSIPNKKSAVLNFVKSCGVDGCLYDLKIDASLILPEYTTEKNEDLTKGGKVLVVDQKTADTPVTVKVNLSNHGENAFDTRIQIEYTSSISLREIKNRIGFPPSNSCVVEDTDPVDVAGGRKRQILRYNYKTNIMRPNASCYFEFGLNTNNLRKNGALKNFSVSVNAYTNDSSDTSKEINDSDNSWGSWPEVRYRSDFTLKKRRQSQISFNYTTEATNITSVTQIGNGTTDIEMEFEVNGQGYSSIPHLDASLVYPMKTKKGDILLYLYKVDCESKEGKSACSCDQRLINSYNLTLEAPNENNTNGSYVEITPPQYPIEASSFDCFTDGEKNFTCETLKCTINDLYQSDQIIFKAYFRLWSSAITFNGSGFDTDELELHSLFRVDTDKSTYIIDENGKSPLTKSEEVISAAKKYTKPVPPEPPKALLWVYILAAIGGLLLLIVLVIILWKVGFFKSKYADMKKDAQDDLADETEFPQNGDGSQADMVD